MTVIEVNAARTCTRADNLCSSMREVYYRLIAAGIRPTHIYAAPLPLVYYEELLRASPDPTTISAAPNTFFKDLLMTCPEAIASDEVHFMFKQEVAGKVTNIS